MHRIHCLDWNIILSPNHNIHIDNIIFNTSFPQPPISHCHIIITIIPLGGFLWYFVPKSLCSHNNYNLAKLTTRAQLLIANNHNIVAAQPQSWRRRLGINVCKYSTERHSMKSRNSSRSLVGKHH